MKRWCIAIFSYAKFKIYSTPSPVKLAHGPVLILVHQLNPEGWDSAPFMPPF